MRRSGKTNANAKSESEEATTAAVAAGAAAAAVAAGASPAAAAAAAAGAAAAAAACIRASASASGAFVQQRSFRRLDASCQGSRWEGRRPRTAKEGSSSLPASPKGGTSSSDTLSTFEGVDRRSDCTLGDSFEEVTRSSQGRRQRVSSQSPLSSTPLPEEASSPSQRRRTGGARGFEEKTAASGGLVLALPEGAADQGGDAALKSPLGEEGLHSETSLQRQPSWASSASSGCRPHVRPLPQLWRQKQLEMNDAQERQSSQPSQEIFCLGHGASPPPSARDSPSVDSLPALPTATCVGRKEKRVCGKDSTNTDETLHWSCDRMPQRGRGFDQKPSRLQPFVQDKWKMPCGASPPSLFVHPPSQTRQSPQRLGSFSAKCLSGERSLNGHLLTQKFLQQTLEVGGSLRTHVD